MKKTIFIFLVAFVLNLNAQNFFSVKIDDCKTKEFCLDGGEVMASYDEEGFSKLIEKLNRELNLRGFEGIIKFQVIVNSRGRACVLSHTDQSNFGITLRIIRELNRLKKWSPAVINGEIVNKTAIVLLFEVKDNKISGHIERVDLIAYDKSFDKPTNPDIYNNTYEYKNENLKSYKITVWNSSNSNLPNNTTKNISIDNHGLIWLTVNEGLVTFDGLNFENAEQNITDKGSYFGYYALAIDNNNVKWIHGKTNIYSFDNTKWTIYDSTQIGINQASEIINNPNTSEVFFCSRKGLVIYKDGIWTSINKNKLKELPSNIVLFAKRDSEKRIWIGTLKGTVMIDENNQVINFENTRTVLKGKSIKSMDEDENGNLFFSLYEFDRKGKQIEDINEGIAIRYADETFKQYTTANSGMPNNNVSCVLYDRNEKVLWISTERAGLVRYDLIKDSWENYHNENSGIPTSSISTMTFDKEGKLYLTTNQGLVKIERK